MEVTRVVVATPAVAPVATPTAANPAVPAPEIVAVTRIVPQEVTRIVPEEVIVEATQSPLGSAERPVQLLFPPAVKTAVISTRGQALAQALAAATGLNYAIGVLDDEKSVIDLMCAAPVDAIGFLSAVGYVLAHERCGVQVGNVAVHPDGLTWQTGMIVYRPDSGITTLDDLAGKRWAVPDSGSVPNALYFQALLAAAGIEVGETVAVAGDSSAMLAVYNRDVDFATAAYVPPIMPYEERLWQYGQDSPEIWHRLGIPPSRSPIGYVLVMAETEYGGYRVRDARSGIFDTTPGIFNETRILTLSARIPNETIAFGGEFPLGLARDVIAVLTDFAASEACITSICSTDFYGWAGLEPGADADYEPIRFLIETLGLTEEGILGP